MAETIRRNHAAEKLISEISEKDKRVAVLGIVSDKNPNNLTARLSDGKESADLAFENDEQFSLADDGSFCRVIGRTLYNDNSVTINIETIKKMNDFNQGLWEKIRAKERELRLYD